MTDRPLTDLEILFPGEAIELAPGVKLTIRPLTMDKIPLLIGSIMRINDLVEMGLGMDQIGAELATDLIQLAPHCMDIPLEKIPVAFAPQIIKALFKVNVTPDMLGNWKALSQDMKGLKTVIGMQEDQPEDQTTGEAGQSDSQPSSPEQ